MKKERKMIMFKVLFKILMSISILVLWILTLIWQSIWSGNFRKITGIFISDFLALWNMSIDDLYIISKVK